MSRKHPISKPKGVRHRQHVPRRDEANLNVPDVARPSPASHLVHKNYSIQAFGIDTLHPSRDASVEYLD